MPITVADDNHIGTECLPLSKTDLKDIEHGVVVWQTLREWVESVESSFYVDYDCSGTYCCELEGEKYKSQISVSGIDAKDEEGIPAWATHVLWYSK